MRSLFLSDGPDPYAHLRVHAADVPCARFEGVWTTVEIQPDVFARQRYTVGVAVAQIDGRVAFRLLDDFALLESILGREGVQQARALVARAEHALRCAQQAGSGLEAIRFEVGGITLGELWYTSGQSVEATVTRLYAEVVPFDRKTKRAARP